MGFDDTMLHSPAVETVSDALNSTTHFLPFVGISMVGVLLLMVRMTHPVAQKGGLTKAASRLQCQEVLQGFLKAVAGDIGDLTEWRIPVVFVYDWKSAWPLPLQHQPDLFLTVSADGMVDLGAWIDWIALSSSKAHSPAQKWMGLLAGLGRQIGLHSLLQIVAHAEPSARAAGFFAQLLSHITARAEKYMRQASKGAATESDTPLHTAMHEPGDLVRTRGMST